MKLKVNVVLQTLITAVQFVNLITPTLPTKFQLWAAVTLSALQGAIGVVAHFSNPDGTPAKATV